jgi:hypothetical protein
MFDRSMNRTNMYGARAAVNRAVRSKNGANRAISQKPSRRAGGVKLARP